MVKVDTGLFKAQLSRISILTLASMLILSVRKGEEGSRRVRGRERKLILAELSSLES